MSNPAISSPATLNLDTFDLKKLLKKDFTLFFDFFVENFR